MMHYWFMEIVWDGNQLWRNCSVNRLSSRPEL